MNTLISDSEYLDYDYWSESDIQTIFDNKNSVLKNNIVIYRENSYGAVYFDGDWCKPSKVISQAASSSKVNPKLILSQLQKESSLVTATSANISSRVFVYALGMGATDSGDLWQYSGFDTQVYEGAALMKSLYDSASSTDTLTINYGHTISLDGVTYPNKINTKNKATYADLSRILCKV